MPKITPGNETKGVSAGKPVVRIPRLRLPKIICDKNSVNNVDSIKIPIKPNQKYDLHTERMRNHMIIKVSTVNPTKTLTSQNQVKNKSDLDKSDITTIPIKVDSINQINIPVKVNQSSLIDIPAKIDQTKLVSIPAEVTQTKPTDIPATVSQAKPVTNKVSIPVGNNQAKSVTPMVKQAKLIDDLPTTIKPIHLVDYIKLLESMLTARICFPAPPIPEVE